MESTKRKRTKAPNGQQELSFNELPKALGEVLTRLESIETKLTKLTEGEQKFSVTGLARYLGRSREGLYKIMKADPNFPIHRDKTGRPYFIKSEIDEYLKEL